MRSLQFPLYGGEVPGPDNSKLAMDPVPYSVTLDTLKGRLLNYSYEAFEACGIPRELLEEGHEHRTTNCNAEEERIRGAYEDQRAIFDKAVAAIQGGDDKLRATESLAISCVEARFPDYFTMAELLKLYSEAPQDRSRVWKALEKRLKKMVEVPVQIPGLSLRGYLCAGVPLPRDARWYDASGVLALNHLAGSRILPNLWEHYRAGNASKKEAPHTTVAELLDSIGRMRAPLLDKRLRA